MCLWFQCSVQCSSTCYSFCRLSSVVSLLSHHHGIVWMQCYQFFLLLPLHTHLDTLKRYLHQNVGGRVVFVVVLTVQALREWRFVSDFFVQPCSPSRFITLVSLSHSILGSEPRCVPDQIIDLACCIKCWDLASMFTNVWNKITSNEGFVSL